MARLWGCRSLGTMQGRALPFRSPGRLLLLQAAEMRVGVPAEGSPRATAAQARQEGSAPLPGTTPVARMELCRGSRGSRRLRAGGCGVFPLSCAACHVPSLPVWRRRGPRASRTCGAGCRCWAARSGRDLLPQPRTLLLRPRRATFNHFRCQST